MDSLLTFQEKDILQGKGSISNEEAETIVKSIYDTFNAKRKQIDAQAADAEDIKMLEDLEKSIIDKNKSEWSPKPSATATSTEATGQKEEYKWYNNNRWLE